MKDEIFISYSSSDRDKAKLLAEVLQAQAYSVWWDRKIPPGKSFDEVIEDKLETAQCVLVLWSEHSVRSKYVKEEASEGDKRGILIPVLIDDILPPFGFRRIQAAKLADWDGASSHPEFKILLESVAEKLGQKSVTEKPKKQKAKPETITNYIGVQFKLIPAGTFKMGSEEFDTEKPIHSVTIEKPFYLGIYPVTQKEWKEIMGTNPSLYKGENVPVEQVSWDDVQKFINKLNEKESTGRYRLPSEAEWEYAARAGITTRYSFGDDESDLGDYAWYDKNSAGKTHPVGQKKPNSWGLYDMHGNVSEWVQDEWHDSYDGAPSDGSAWEGGDGTFRVIRGGSWLFNARGCRSAFRGNGVPSLRDYALGFRLLQEL